MGNEHTEYAGEVDVPVEAIKIIDPEVIKSQSFMFSWAAIYGYPARSHDQ